MAQVPYSRGVSDVAPDVRAPNDYQQIQASPAEFGGLIAQGEEKAGAGASTAGKFFGEVAADDATNKFLSQSNDILFGTGKTDPTTGQPDGGFYSLRGEDAMRAAPTVKAKLDQLRTELRGNMQTPDQAELFDQNTRRMQFYMQGEIGRHYDQQFQDWGGKVNEDGYRTTLNSIALRPEDDVFAADAAQRALSYRTKQLQLAGQTSPEALSQARTQTAQDVTEARIKALAPTNPVRANAILNANRNLLQGSANYDQLNRQVDSGTAASYKSLAAQDLTGAMAKFNTDRSKLSPEVQADLDGWFTQRQQIVASTALTQQMRSMAFEDKTRRDNAQKSGNGFVSQMLKDPSQVNPAMIANDPNLDFEQKWSLNKMLETSLTKTPGNLLSSTYGAGFVPALKAVQADPSDPTRITDPAQIWKMAGEQGNISPAGVSALTGIINGRQTPDGEAANKIQVGALAYAKHQISFEADYGTVKIPDPKGQDAYNIGFIPAFLKYWGDGLKAGKTPYELSSKDEIDKLIAPFKRPPAQEVHDRLEADAAAPEGLPATAAPVLPKPGEVRDGYTFKGGDPAKQESWEALPVAPMAH